MAGVLGWWNRPPRAVSTEKRNRVSCLTDSSFYLTVNALQKFHLEFCLTLPFAELAMLYFVIVIVIIVVTPST